MILQLNESDISCPNSDALCRFYSQQSTLVNRVIHEFIHMIYAIFKAVFFMSVLLRFAFRGVLAELLEKLILDSVLHSQRVWILAFSQELGNRRSEEQYVNHVRQQHILCKQRRCLLEEAHLRYNLDMDELIIIGSKYLIFLVGFLAVVATLFSEKTIRNSILKLAILSFSIAFLLAFITGHFFFDSRPFVVEHVKPLIPHAPDNGFPSDHALAGMVAAGTLFVYHRKVGVLLGILAIIVGVFRVMARVHYPVDIVGSAAIAAFATYASWTILGRLHRR